MKELIVPAKIENLEQVLAFVQSELEAVDCPVKTQIQMAIAVEEIYVNIAHYAYNPKVGEAVIRCQLGEQPLRVVVQFEDAGKPYNPLAHTDPDITLSADEREIGGLGIYMVKQSMDQVEYRYEDGKNILTIQKVIA